MSPHPKSKQSKQPTASDVVTEFLIGHHDMELIYMSPDPYGKLFEECIDLRKCNLTSHQTGGLQFLTKNNRLILSLMDPGTPGARIDKWRTRLRGAWLVSINGHPVHSLPDVHRELLLASKSPPSSCVLLFLHPEVAPNISNQGVPIMSSSDFTQYMLLPKSAQ